MKGAPEILVVARERVRADVCAERLGARLGERARTRVEELAGLRDAAGARPGALVALVTGPDDPVLAALGELGSPRPTLVVSGPASDAGLVLRAMRLGAAEFVDQEEGVPGLERVLRSRLAADASTAALAGGRVVGVLGAKGGVGATCVAVQLAVDLQALGHRVALFDLGQAPGDVGLHLDVTPHHALVRAAVEAETLDTLLVRSLLIGHASGVEVLAASASSEDAERLTGHAVEAALGVLRSEFDWVIVDLGRGWTEGTLRTLDAVERLLLVTQAEVPCLVNARRQLDLLAELGVAPEAIRLVETRHGGEDAIPERDLERFLGRGLDARIPEDPKLIRCLNEGRTLAEGAPYGDAQRAMMGLARQLLAWSGAAQVEPRPNGLLERVRVGIGRRRRGAA